MNMLKPTLNHLKVYAIIDQHLHWLDHLCPLCHFLNIPLIASDERAFNLISSHYFDVPSMFIPAKELNLSFIEQNIDVLISSSQSSLFETSKLVKSIYQKEIRTIYLPHGNSDKGFSNTYIDYLKDQDLSFYYGKQMLDHLVKRSIFPTLNGVVRTGNFRRSYFEKYQTDYVALAKKHVFSQFNKNQKTILYAPTWNDTENLSSFYDVCTPLIENLPSYYNLIIKPHPYLEEQDPAKFYLLTYPFENKPNVIVLQDYFAIYSLLDQVDIYLGDFSSIGYDALSFDIPLFFLNTTDRKNSDDKGLYLHNSGISIPTSAQGEVFDFIDNHIEENSSAYKTRRKKTYDYCFETPVPSHSMKTHLLKTLEKKAAQSKHS